MSQSHVDIEIHEAIKDPRTVARFVRFVETAETGCHIWTGSKSGGYGSFYLGKAFNYRFTRAHRIAWALAGGELREGVEIDHVCRNTACVRVHPDHLEMVPHSVNTLRGIGPTAINSRKTHCQRGHELSGDNLRLTVAGTRNCRTCLRISNRARKARLREKALIQQEKSAK